MIDGSSTPEDLRMAFVECAKWWEWVKSDFTMCQSDQKRAYERAVEKYPEPIPGEQPCPQCNQHPCRCERHTHDEGEE